MIKLTVSAGLLLAICCTPVTSAQTFFSLHAGSDGVGVDVTNVNPYFPVIVAPALPVRAVHVPLMPGFHPEPLNKRSLKAAKEYRKAAKHYRKALEYGMYAIPAGLVYYDDDDIEDYYEDYCKHIRKVAKMHHKYHKKQGKHDKHHHKHHPRHHHDKD